MRIYLVVLVSIFILDLSCGSKKSEIEYDHPSPLALGSCAFEEYKPLPDAIARKNEACFVNGNEFNGGKVNDSGSLDGCNAFSCVSDESGRKIIVTTLVRCVNQRNVCLYKGWLLSHCFKFLDESARKCECSDGEVKCDFLE